jgi:hypothetical protein
VEVHVTVAPESGRRLAFPFWKTRTEVANASVNGPAGDWKIPLFVPGDVREFLLEDLNFPLFKSVPLKIAAHAEFGRQFQDVSGAGVVKWPHVAAHPGGRGSGSIIKSISGPKKVSLRARSATFTIKMGRWPGVRLFKAGLVSAGGLILNGEYKLFHGKRLAGQDILGGGTFLLKIPIASSANKLGIKRAASVAPIAAMVQVGILNKHGSNGQDNSVFRFTLTR